MDNKHNVRITDNNEIIGTDGYEVAQFLVGDHGLREIIKELKTGYFSRAKKAVDIIVSRAEAAGILTSDESQEALIKYLESCETAEV